MAYISRGLVLLREAILSRDYARAEAEVTLLHNIPSLLDEPNIERHRYFWFVERAAHIEWASAPGREASLSCMNLCLKCQEVRVVSDGRTRARLRFQ